jgi:hypothetical protein
MEKGFNNSLKDRLKKWNLPDEWVIQTYWVLIELKKYYVEFNTDVHCPLCFYFGCEGEYDVNNMLLKYLDHPDIVCPWLVFTGGECTVALNTIINKYNKKIEFEKIKKKRKNRMVQLDKWIEIVYLEAQERNIDLISHKMNIHKNKKL